MRNCVWGFLDSRIQEIAQTLRENHVEYAAAVEKRKSLLKSIDPILHSETGLSVSAEDCIALREYFAQEFTVNAIFEQELYKQGYMDCIQLLFILGILGGKDQRL